MIELTWMDSVSVAATKYSTAKKSFVETKPSRKFLLVAIDRLGLASQCTTSMNTCLNIQSDRLNDLNITSDNQRNEDLVFFYYFLSQKVFRVGKSRTCEIFL